jgi:YHS domain-containing protein
MNAIFRFAVKGCLVAAASGAVFNETIGLLAQDSETAPRIRATSPTITQTAGVQGSSAAPQSAAPQGTSEVQKQLEALYRKNGREMPSMNMDDLPGTDSIPGGAGPVGSGPVTPSPQTSPAPAMAPSRPAVKPGKPNWFERLFHVGRGRRQPAPVAQPTRPAAPMPRQPQRIATAQPAPRPTAPEYRTPSTTTTPVPQTQVPQTQVPQTQVPQTPAQPRLREPAPIGAPTDPSSQASRPGAPGATPGQRSGISSPLLDESDMDDDSDSLDMGRDDQPKFVNQPPQIRPSETPTAPKTPDSPYTGLTISPNEMEQKIATIAKPYPPADSSNASKPSDDSPATPKGNTGMMDDDDDSDDDDESLTLPFDDPDKSAKKAAEASKSTDSENTTPAAEKPAVEKESEKRPGPLPMKGFRGFCPVTLKDERKLVEARSHIQSNFHGKTYTFSSVEAREAFEDNPHKYVPAGEGNDVVRLSNGDTGIEGSIEHAAWYRGRLYLFSSAETRREFVETPSKFSVND